MRITLVAAVAENGVIGRDGALPWRLSGDLRRFRELTTGHHVVMGRRTWESIGRPLPGRTNVVLSRDPFFRPEHASVVVEPSLEDAIAGARLAGETELFVIGGAEVYARALPLADRIELTRVHGQPPGETVLDGLDWAGWREVACEAFPADARHDYPFSFVSLVRADRP